jgi:hypothetical protein
MSRDELKRWFVLIWLIVGLGMTMVGFYVGLKDYPPTINGLGYLITIIGIILYISCIEIGGMWSEEYMRRHPRH